MRRYRPLVAILVVASFALRAQDAGAPAPETCTVADTSLRYVVQVPPAWRAGTWVPLVVAFPASEGLDAARAAVDAEAEAVAAGFVVAAPVREPGPAADAAQLAPCFAALRRRFRIEQGGMHAVLHGGDEAAVAAVRANLNQFQTVGVVGTADAAQLDRMRRVPARRAVGLPADAAARAQRLRALHDERAFAGAAADVARTLDDFHDAAANADAARYFAILPDDAVFLGTDGTERWTGAAFRRELQRWFERDSAWTYVALRRAVEVAPGGELAWFDETLDNDGYGECRGSGVLARRDGRWVLRQYVLSVPVPNDVMRGVAARIRAFQDGRDGATTVVVVRHAEKEGGDGGGPDPALSAAGRARAAALAQVLRDVPVGAAFATQYRRTGETIAPVCAQHALAPTILAAADSKGLAQRIRSECAGGTALVCGHSNTVPAILAALGVAAPPAIGDDEYDRLFVVAIGADGTPTLLALRYGD